MRWFLITSLMLGGAIAVYSVNFNLYLAAAGVAPATIGLLASITWVATLMVSFPTADAVTRLGYRQVALVAMAVVAAGGVALLALPPIPGAILGAAGFGAGNGAFTVLETPYMADRAKPERRGVLFSAQFAITNVTALAALAASSLLLPHGGAAKPSDYSALLILVVVFGALATASCLGWGSEGGRQTGSMARASMRYLQSSIGSTLRVDGLLRIALPWSLIMFGAGQLMPFLNLFIQDRFGLPASTVNLVFAIAQIGTLAAVLAQPLLVRRVGQVVGVAGVQAGSVPFLLLIGFSPAFAIVAGSMVVRNALMTAANPTFFLFSMEHVRSDQRALTAAALSLIGSLAFVLGGWWYSVSQAILGFDTGYAVGFVVVSTLYVVAAVVFWRWSGALPRDEESHL